jgi:hypothetical protein
VKYVDAAGRQVKERLGRTTDGWTERKAKAELDARLTDVRRDGLRKPHALTFASFADEWLATYPDAKGLKRSTRESYKTIIERHLKPALGHLRSKPPTWSRSSATWPGSGGRDCSRGR